MKNKNPLEYNFSRPAGWYNTVVEDRRAAWQDFWKRSQLQKADSRWSACLSAFAETALACLRHGWCMHWTARAVRHSQCTPRKATKHSTVTVHPI